MDQSHEAHNTMLIGDQLSLSSPSHRQSHRPHRHPSHSTAAFMSQPDSSAAATGAAAPTATAATPAVSQPCSCSPNPTLSDEFAAEAQRAVAAAEASSAAAASAASEEEDESDDDSNMSAKWASLMQPAGAGAAPSIPPALAFEWQRHVQFFNMHLKSIPQGYESLDTSRMTLLYFCLSALDVLGALDAAVISKGLAPKIIDWIYAQQVHPYTDPATGAVDLGRCGFRGGTALGVPFEPLRTRGHSPAAYPHDHGHVTMTYTALCNLRILGDASFSRVNRPAIIGALAHLQQADGSFSSTAQRSESDMRFLYCACAISSMLADWTGFDVERSVRFIAASQSYDGGVGLWPGCEGHGGSTYCAVASLTLMNKLDRLPNPTSLLKWCMSNQGSGYRGRPNKPEDSCYSFWIGASLAMLGQHLGLDIGSDWTKRAENRLFNLRCQHKIGGFSKEPGPYYPDLLHAYMAVCGLSLIGMDEQLQSIDVVLGLTKKSAGSDSRKLDGSSL